jgi:hypothetical protein
MLEWQRIFLFLLSTLYRKLFSVCGENWLGLSDLKKYNSRKISTKRLGKFGNLPCFRDSVDTVFNVSEGKKPIIHKHYILLFFSFT